MASWQIKFGPDSKANIAAALAGAQPFNATAMDPGAVDLTEALFVAHFNAAIAAATGIVSAMFSAVPNIQIEILGYRDTNTDGHANQAASKVWVRVTEFF